MACNPKPAPSPTPVTGWTGGRPALRQLFEGVVRWRIGVGTLAVVVLALPVLTVLGTVFGRMLEGAVIVEVIFNWSGIGNLTYNAILIYDYPVVVGTVLCGGVVFVLLNLLIDLSYGLVDPRVRLGAPG